jgi:hypothetical protein
MKRSLSTVSLLLLVPVFFCCSPKPNASKPGQTGKAGEVKPDTTLKSAPKDYNQRVIHNTDDPKSVDSLKNLRGKDKK